MTSQRACPSALTKLGFEVSADADVHAVEPDEAFDALGEHERKHPRAARTTLPRMLERSD